MSRSHPALAEATNTLAVPLLPEARSTVHDASEFETIIAAQARRPNGGLVVMPDPFPFVHRAEITSLAIRHRLPAVYSNRGYAEHGGLLSYGADLVDNLRASYGDRI